MAQLALRLRTLRAQRRLSMSRLQYQSQLGKTTVSQALNGNLVPSEATVVALARALGTDVEPLLALRRQACPAQDGAGSLRVPHAMALFEERYRRYVADKHGNLTVVGLDLSHSRHGAWPLDASYLSLEVAQSADGWQTSGRDTGPSHVVRRAEQALIERPRVLLKGSPAAANRRCSSGSLCLRLLTLCPASSRTSTAGFPSFSLCGLWSALAPCPDPRSFCPLLLLNWPIANPMAGRTRYLPAGR